MVEREIGRGAMATIFLATDIRHDRPVALKVLRPELAVNLGAERFLREIRVIAQLQHPHILPLYDSGECAGCLYYVAPYVGEDTLRARIAREGHLPVADTIRLTTEIADALGYAHAHQVVHRDIKPDNILLMDDHALVADFGIARAIRLSGGHRLSEPGVTLGTPMYMSPEQASGDRDVDGRSDLYSLGVVLHEMLTGSAPFKATTERQVIAMHLTEPPSVPSEARDGTPAALDYVVRRAMAKDPADRFQTADEMVRALTLPEAHVPADVPGSARGRASRLRRVGPWLVLLLAAVAGWLLLR